MNQSQRRQYLIQALLAERPEYDGWGVPQDAGEQKRLLRGLLNVRPPQECDGEFLKIQDAYLRQAIAEKGVTDAGDLEASAAGAVSLAGEILPP